MIINLLKHRFRKTLLIATLIGPGLITAFADNDAGGVATYSSAAAKYGYLSLFTLIPITVVLWVTQEVGGRLALVGKKGLADLIREHYGVRASFIVFGVLAIVNFGVVLQNVSGLKSAFEIFGLNYNIALPIAILALIVFIIKTPYKIFERFFLFLIFFYITFFLSAILARPDWRLAVGSLIIPAGRVSIDYIYTSMAVLGTTVTAWGQFYVNSSMVDKQIDVKYQKYSQIEILVGSILTNFVSFFMMVAVSATIFINGIVINSAKDAAIALKPFAGSSATLLFASGLFVASIVGAVVVPLSTAYVFSELFGLRRSMNETFSKGKTFYYVFGIQLVLGMAVTLMPFISLFKITLLADFLNGAVLPAILFFLYQFGNNGAILGDKRNTATQNFLLIVSAIAILTGTFISIAGKIWSF
jgi:NRAMP (natural resistance-associated macrophage protein)-like metal ion transporter